MPGLCGQCDYWKTNWVPKTACMLGIGVCTERLGIRGPGRVGFRWPVTYSCCGCERFATKKDAPDSEPMSKNKKARGSEKGV